VTEVPISTQRLLAILSASAPASASVTINYSSEPGSVESYESAIAMIEAAGGTVERKVQTLSIDHRPYEVSRVDPNEFGIAEVTLIGPFEHVGYDPDTRVAPTPEGKLALRVIQGGVA
jgi:hypothetical protein